MSELCHCHHCSNFHAKSQAPSLKKRVSYGQFSDIWFGLVWFGLVWFGMVWFCMLWYLGTV